MAPDQPGIPCLLCFRVHQPDTVTSESVPKGRRRQRVVQLYEATGQTEQAARWRKEQETVKRRRL
jgi:hypothetical protein